MALEAEIDLIVGDLPENDVWWANVAAWKNYWRDLKAKAVFEPAATTVYIPSVYDNNLVPAAFQVDGINYIVTTKDMFESLLNRVNILNSAFEDMRTQMKDAGFIKEAQ